MNRQRGRLWAVALAVILSLQLLSSEGKGACDLNSVFQGKWYLPGNETSNFEEYGFGRGAKSRELVLDRFDCRIQMKDPNHPLYLSSQYRWAPQSCTVPYTYPSKEFAKWFLERFRNQKLLFYGDSKVKQVAMALMRLILQRRRVPKTLYGENGPQEMKLTTKSTTVFFIRSNFLGRLKGGTKVSKSGLEVSIGELDPLIDKTIRQCPPFIFVGTGAWWSNRKRMYRFRNGTAVDADIAYREHLKEVIPEMGRMCPSSKLIFLDANFPHWMTPKDVVSGPDGYSSRSFCNITTPLSYDHPKDVEMMTQFKQVHQRLSLSWLFDHRSIPNAYYVSMENFLVQRADMHPGTLHHKTYDCSHFCEPGPIDYGGIMLVQAIVAQFGMT